ncbi:MAG: cation-transporting P-type ATPase [Deltaproteobacteria bacterium]|nr:cation-transporting P-type ATPase [Deltaproteobacteria bacterium]
MPFTFIETLPIAQVYAAAVTRPRGLTNAEAAARLQQYGRNAIRSVAATSLVHKFSAHFTHLMALLLWVGGLIGFIAHLPQLGIAIWTVNLINGIFSFWQEYKAEKATEALRRLLPTYCRVLREGVEQRIFAEEIVPGDIVLLAEGDHISTDMRLVQEAEMRVDQSTLTGEWHPVRKRAETVPPRDLTRAEIPNLVFAGTSVIAGVGTGVVFATGMNTEFGKIAHLTQEVGETLSPLQQEMMRATKVVTLLAMSIGVLFFVLGIGLTDVTLAEGFIFAMGMIVAFVPEGMLPTVTLALAMGTQRMAHRQALIKRLSAVETLGCTTVICTDKTGTLTQNEMTVRELWTAEQRLTVTGTGYATEGQLFQDDRPVVPTLESDVGQLLIAAGLCTDARLVPPNNDSQQWTALGDPTEAALLVVARKARIDLQEIARQRPRLRELPFNSHRKQMSTLHEVRDAYCTHPGSSLPESHRPAIFSVYLKGAPKEVLSLCTHLQLHGQTCVLDDAQRAHIITANDDYARAGLRVLAVAQRTFVEYPPSWTPETVEHDLTFLGLIAMMDPPRTGVAEAVAKCHRAGIRLIMLTGDYGLTAESIARRIGILRSAQPQSITGNDLLTMTDAALKTVLQSEVIFARVAPEHKLRIVTALQQLGHIVAVTGDGVNDAPALRKADIGIAMGVAGTDVAKEAADMILADDNFASIVSAVEEGRAVYANIKKFITYIFTSNIPEAIPFILFAFSGGRIPLALNVMQILSIDLGTDLVPALALGAEAPEPGVMEAPPRKQEEHVITRSLLLRSYLWLGLLQSGAAMAAFYFAYWTNGYWGQWLDLPANGELHRMATSMTLASVVATQIGNLFAQRTAALSAFRVGMFSNRLVWVGIVVELGLIFALLYVPLLQTIFGTAAFPLHNWWFLAAWVPLLFVADEVWKALVRRKAV